MKIALIGPFPPYRGGISMFNHSLSEELSIDHDLFKISFSRQYPKFLFPGKSEIDEINDNTSERIIDSLNPLSWRKVANRLTELNPDIAIFQFWHPYFSICYLSIIKKLTKSKKTKIVLNCNNILPHEKFPFDGYLAKKLLQSANSIIVMSKEVEKQLLNLIDKPNYKKLNHPNYKMFGKSISKSAAKKILDIKKSKVMLHFGLIRNYKGLDILLRSIKKIENQLDDFLLLVAGECYEDEKYYVNLVNELEINSIVKLKLKFIPKEKVSTYFCASDVVLLPYRSATQSGIIPIAYQFLKPVIVSNVGGLPDVVHNGKTGFICEPTVQSLSKSILKFFNSKKIDFSKNIKKENRSYSWKYFCKELIKLTK